MKCSWWRPRRAFAVAVCACGMTVAAVAGAQPAPQGKPAPADAPPNKTQPAGSSAAPGAAAASDSGASGAQKDPAAAPADPSAPAAAGPSAPASGAQTSSAPPAPPAATGLSTADEAYELKVKTLEERVNELKEKIFRSKQRLAQLQEAVVGGVSSGAKAKIMHVNDMGAVFKLREMHYFLDGAPLRQEVDASGDGLNVADTVDLFDGAIIPGNHQITVNLVYQGSGYGVFSYLDGYTFKVRSSHTFTAEEGKEVVVKAVAYEQGNATTEIQDRPTIRYDMQIRPLKVPGQNAPEATPAAGGGDAKPAAAAGGGAP